MASQRGGDAVTSALIECFDVLDCGVVAGRAQGLEPVVERVRDGRAVHELAEQHVYEAVDDP